jgi:two-component system response regulator YesN
MRLLLVDDERAVREEIIGGIDWVALDVAEVNDARNGYEALEIARTIPPDILLTDIKMPRMNGIDLAKQIRALYPDCGILILSGYPETDYLRSVIQLRAVNFIDKPVDLELLARMISGAVSEQANLREQKRLRRMAQGFDLLNAKPLLAPPQFQQAGTMEQVVDYLHRNYMGKSLTLAAVSRVFYMSSAHLCVLFKAHTGKTFIRYLTDYRIAKSLSMLADTQRRIEDIAQAVGFDSGNYYSKVFKKALGVSPQEYRRRG